MAGRAPRLGRVGGPARQALARLFAEIEAPPRATSADSVLGARTGAPIPMREAQS